MWSGRAANVLFRDRDCVETESVDETRAMLRAWFTTD